MNEILTFWAQWLRPSAGLPTVQWSLLLAVAAMAGYLTQRHTGLPKVLGYSLVGTAAGLAGFSGAVWPLQGIGLFLWGRSAMSASTLTPKRTVRSLQRDSEVLSERVTG